MQEKELTRVVRASKKEGELLDRMTSQFHQAIVNIIDSNGKALNEHEANTGIIMNALLCCVCTLHVRFTEESEYHLSKPSLLESTAFHMDRIMEKLDITDLSR